MLSSCPLIVARFIGCVALLWGITGCAGDTALTPESDNTPLAPYISTDQQNGQDYIAPPPGRKTGNHIVVNPTSQIFMGEWVNNSDLCKLIVRENNTCRVYCTDPAAINPDDIFGGTWSIEGAQLVVVLDQKWWHGQTVRMEYDEQQKALYKVLPSGERIFLFDKKR